MVGSAVEIARALRRAGTDSAGELHSRVDYTPYGVAMHSYAADLNGNGTIDGTDVGIFLTNLNSGSPLEPGDAGYDPDADLSGDGLSETQTHAFNSFQCAVHRLFDGREQPDGQRGLDRQPSSNQPVVDPSDPSQRGNYLEFCVFLCVPPGGVDVD